ncbi:hypothetical protein QYF36_013420 [Acer negundo]|nr:hypothetical protein QYF36_013420 [Acer negundo]
MSRSQRLSSLLSSSKLKESGKRESTLSSLSSSLKLDEQISKLVVVVVIEEQTQILSYDCVLLMMKMKLGIVLMKGFEI